MDTLLVDALVPALVRRRFAAHSGAFEPAAEQFDAALLLSDLTGFSAVAETFARRGTRGAEDLKDVLNFFFGRLVDLVDAHGGEVLTFPGDAVLALWPANGTDAAAVASAAQCAAAARETFATLDAPHGARLHLRYGLGYGHLWAAHVGGVAGRWQLVVAGDEITHLANAIASVGPNEITLTESISRVGITDAKPPQRIAFEAPAATEACLRAFVPRAVQVRLDAGQRHWLGEFRRATVMFANLEGIDYAAHDALDQLQRAVTDVQTAVYRYGGTVNQILLDDKGTVVTIGWGLALHAHGDNEVRAVRAALDVQRSLKDAGLGSSFGIATGEVFTGLRGNDRRCEYAMIGDTVNVAARLMQLGRGEILCDGPSFEVASQRIVFDALAPVRVKGRDRAVDVFRPREMTAHGVELVGRHEERRLLRERLDALVRTHVGGVVILDGDPGIGKSRLLADLIERAVGRGVRTIVGAGDAIERSTPYHVWSALFDNLLGLDALTGRGGAERRVMELLDPEPDLQRFAPLLNPVLRLNFRENESTTAMSPRGRAQLTQTLLLHLFRQAVDRRPTLLALDDAHWFDSASWGLAEAIEREVSEVLLVLAMRPLGTGNQPPDLQRLAARRDATLIHLDMLSLDETYALVCRRLRARSLSDPVVQVIRRKAEGHPFFTEEVAYALRDRGLITITDGVCQFAPTVTGDALQLPDTVQVVVSSRIDQLTVPLQLTLKVASVFGQTFDASAVQAVYPIPIELDHLREHFKTLAEYNLLKAAPDASDHYAFKHTITQEVAYSLLPFSLRRALHSAVAGWYERQHPDDVTALYGLLAHHWSRAEAMDKALDYLEKAADDALRRHANEEAIRFYSEAIEVDDKRGEPVQATPSRASKGDTVSDRDARHMRWHRRIGDAWCNLGRWDEGRHHFERALSLSGHTLPASNREWATGLLKQVLIQCRQRMLGRSRRSVGARAELLHDTVCAYARVGTTAYHYERMIEVLYCMVSALNLGERIAPTAEWALLCADVGNICGLAPMPRLAQKYHRIAVDTSTRLNDPVTAVKIPARAAVYQLTAGNWKACEELEAAMAVYDRIGDSYMWEEAAAIRTRGAHIRGEFELASQLGAEIRRRAALSRSTSHEVWGFDAEAWGVLYLGDLQRALELADAGLELVNASKRTDTMALLDLVGVRALAQLFRGEMGQAAESAERISNVLSRTPRPRYFAVLYLSAAIEISLALWEAEGRSGRSALFGERVKRLCAQLDRYARINPPAAARSHLWRGCAEWLQGRHTAARTAWLRSISDAERFGLPYEVARAHHEIGRRHPLGDPLREHHLAEAAARFETLKVHQSSRPSL
ncbi:MAG TPA: AAA family ATPase [Vicinamibacterales bacterium]|nr:AAA family ATPase [Vicinamibacterales bacterium]